MAQANVNIRMDEETKVAFDKFCNEIGLSGSAAFNIFAKTVVREQRIPFELSIEKPNAETLAAMREYDDMKSDPRKYKRYSSFKEAMSEALDET